MYFNTPANILIEFIQSNLFDYKPTTSSYKIYPQGRWKVKPWKEAALLNIASL